MNNAKDGHRSIILTKSNMRSIIADERKVICLEDLLELIRTAELSEEQIASIESYIKLIIKMTK